ncbi:VOC family protein [Streptomyces montanus]|uniref:VOC family protein n=1 Tax=Streptomyces montanus TaxID=2580423 RepID=A0A5R9FQM2_9ACTN|nr:VOC family protein [Streptomyces montanus]TLS44396.1 VOC family protein [Streptomyces montanus]
MLRRLHRFSGASGSRHRWTRTPATTDESDQIDCDGDQIAVISWTPDGHGRLELTKFHTPKAISAEPANAPTNTLGIRRIMFAVDDIEDVLARLQTHGAQLVGEVEQFEDSYRLCYVRGPEGILVGLAEQLS